MKNKYFGIYIPVYNGDAFIETAVESVLRQTITDWHLTVIDNQSTDRTWEILQQKYSADPRISLSRNTENLGMRGNLNRCLETALDLPPHWMGILPADDAYVPHALETIKRETEASTDITIWTHGHYVFGQGVTPNVCPVYLQRRMFSSQEFAKLLYIRGNIFGELSSYFFKWGASSHRPLRFLDGNQNVDVNFWIRFSKMAPTGTAVYWPEFLTQVMQHPQSASSQNHAERLDEADYLHSIGALSDLGWSRSIFITQWLRIVRFALKRRFRLSPETWKEFTYSIRKITSHILNKD